MYGKIVLLCFLCAPAIKCTAQFEQKDPIDTYYENCIKKDSSPVNVSNCTFETYGKWDDDLNKYYNRLLKELDSQNDKLALKQAQKAWIAYRDAEFKLYDKAFNISGQQWTKIRQENRIIIIRERTLLLKSYYNSLKENK